MMDKKIEDSSKSDDARAQHLQEKYDELVKEMQTKQVYVFRKNRFPHI